jgi:hypothetical protein
MYMTNRQRVSERMNGTDHPSVNMTEKVFKFNEIGTMNKYSTESCSICLENYKAEDDVKMFPGCRHLFHNHCIKEWLKKGGKKCSFCNRPLYEEREEDLPSYLDEY